MKKVWEVKKLGEVGNIFNGNSINQKTKKEKYSDITNGISFVATKDIGFDKLINYQNGINIPHHELSKFKIAPKNTPLICIEGGSAGKKIGFTTEKICFGNKLFALVPNINIDAKFIFYYYSSPIFKEYFFDEITGMIGGVSKNKFTQIPIPTPPLEEQKQIVEILDKAFEKINEGIKIAKQNLKNAKELFESYLQEVFENKGDSWEVRKLGEVCEILDKLRKPITKRNRISGDYPYYGATGVLDYVNNFIFNERLVLIGEDGAKWKSGDNTSFIVDGKYWVNNHAHVVRPNRNDILDKWLVFYLNHSDLSIFITGLTVPKLNQEKLKNITIPTPPLEEQNKIVNKLNQLQETTKALEFTYQQKLANLEELKKSILQKAFNGQLIN